MLGRGQGSFRLLLNYISFALSGTIFGGLRLRNERYDAVFVFEPSPITVGIPAIVLRRLKRCPVAFWVLDQWPETLAAVGAVKSQAGLQMVGRLASLIYTRCDLILAPSRSIISQIRKYCAVDKRIVYFPNWAESTYLTDNCPAASEVPDWAGGFTVMFAGNMGDSQDMPAVLDAADTLRTNTSVRWVIVGDGRAAGWVRNEIARRGLHNNVLLLGRFPVERMPSFFKRASALLVSLKPDPVFSMTVPGKIQSYLAFGIPILAMLDGEGARVVQQAQAGLTCAAGDSMGLVQNVLRMASMTELERSKMGMNGAAFARAEFGRDGLVTKLENMLTDLARTRAEAYN